MHGRAAPFGVLKRGDVVGEIMCGSRNPRTDGGDRQTCAQDVGLREGQRRPRYGCGDRQRSRGIRAWTKRRIQVEEGVAQPVARPGGEDAPLDLGWRCDSSGAWKARGRLKAGGKQILSKLRREMRPRSWGIKNHLSSPSGKDRRTREDAVER